MKITPPETQKKINACVTTTLIALLIGGLMASVILRWSCDDSFISIRYADNLVNGLGLVYNAGEYVEGYTNLLWTLLIALAMKIGFSPVSASQNLGIFFYAALAVSLACWSYYRSRKTKTLFLPLAAALVLISNDFQVWATGGLETSLFAFLSVLPILLTRIEPRNGFLPSFIGFLFGLLVITRPDGILLSGVGILSYWIPLSRFSLKARIKYSLYIMAPLGMILAALVVFKLSYYGNLFPTAFYSKSVMKPYYSQGIIYIGLYLARNWFLPLSAIALTIMFCYKPYFREFKNGNGNGIGNIIVFLAAAILFLSYLTHVGGDYMFARRIIPVIPFVFLVIEEIIARNRSVMLRYGLAFAFLAMAAAPYPLYSEKRPIIHGIVDERRFYPPQLMEIRKRQGEIAGRALSGVNPRVTFEGGMCVFGYYSRLPYLVELTGLTQYSLAKLPISQRGNIGHEKKASIEWLRKNKIHIAIKQHTPQTIKNDISPMSYNDIYFGEEVKGLILIYSDDIMNSLRTNPVVTFIPIERVIEKFKQEMEQSSLQQAEELFKTLNDYYFREAGQRGVREASMLKAIIEKKQRQATVDPTESQEQDR